MSDIASKETLELLADYVAWSRVHSGVCRGYPKEYACGRLIQKSGREPTIDDDTAMIADALISSIKPEKARLATYFYFVTDEYKAVGRILGIKDPRVVKNLVVAGVSAVQTGMDFADILVDKGIDKREIPKYIRRKHDQSYIF